MKNVGALVVASAVLLPFSAAGQDVGQARTCSREDLNRSWLFTYQHGGDPVACQITVNKRGKIEAGRDTFCLVGVPASDPTPVSGKLNINTDCTVSGQIEAEPIGSFLLQSNLAADKSTITGLLLVNDEVGRFFPVTFTRWVIAPR